jgi:hypothetical protein
VLRHVLQCHHAAGDAEKIGYDTQVQTPELMRRKLLDTIRAQAGVL